MIPQVTLRVQIPHHWRSRDINFNVYPTRIHILVAPLAVGVDSSADGIELLSGTFPKTVKVRGETAIL